MAAVPVVINGVMLPKQKGGSDKPVPAVFIGYATIAGLEVGGGPVIPEIPPDPPIDVPPKPEQPPASLAVVIKPAPATGGWGLAANDQQLKWFWSPADSGAQPKR